MSQYIAALLLSSGGGAVLLAGAWSKDRLGAGEPEPERSGSEGSR